MASLWSGFVSFFVTFLYHLRIASIVSLRFASETPSAEKSSVPFGLAGSSPKGQNQPSRAIRGRPTTVKGQSAAKMRSMCRLAKGSDKDKAREIVNHETKELTTQDSRYPPSAHRSRRPLCIWDDQGAGAVWAGLCILVFFLVCSFWCIFVTIVSVLSSRCTKLR